MKDPLYLYTTRIELISKYGLCKIELDNKDGWARNVEQMCLKIGKLTGIEGNLLYNAVTVAHPGHAIRSFTAALPEKENTEDVS